MNTENLPKGTFGPYRDNEVELRSTIDDAVKYRGSKPGEGRGIMALSANQIRDGGQGEDEVILFQMKRAFDDPHNLAGEYWLGANDGSGADDRAMQPLLILRHGDIWMETSLLDALIAMIQSRLGQPVPAAPVPAAPAPTPAPAIPGEGHMGDARSLAEWDAAAQMIKRLYTDPAELGRRKDQLDLGELMNWMYHWREEGQDEATIRAEIRGSAEWKNKHPGQSPAEPSPAEPP